GPCSAIEECIPRQSTSVLAAVPPKLYGTGEHVRDWIHVDDHNLAVLEMLSRGKFGETYNIGADQKAINNREVIALICELMGIPGQYEHVADRPGHDQRYAMDASKLREQLGWQPQYTNLPDGLKQTIAWYT